MTDFSQKSISLIKSLGYTFIDEDLLALALTHSSHNGVSNNQRLEFLGDAILNMVIAEYLYQQNPNATEGDLTRIRSNLVKGDTLSLIAKKYSIQKCIIFGMGELKTGGYNKNSILADTLEAIIAAIYLDSNLLTIKNLIISWYNSVNYLQPANVADQLTLKFGSKDSKTVLQELLHSKGLELPVYKTIKITGKAHNQTFTVSCTVAGIVDPIYGVGSNRKKAEQDAAHKILELLL